MNGIQGLHHVGISTPDLDRLVAFYIDLFGFVEQARASWGPGTDQVDAATGLADSAGEMVMLVCNGSFLELFRFDQPDPGPARPDRPVSNTGINHICLAVDDVAAEQARLSAAGMQFHSEPQDIGDGPFTYGRDPDGNVVELWQTDL